MNLIGYSDSEDSGNDAPQPLKAPVNAPAQKGPFQKVVDRSNPGKIKLDLPTAERDDIEEDAPPAKRARVTKSAFSGFNAMLPAPKKPNANTTAPAPSESGKRPRGKGLGSGISLRTGSEPSFKRQRQGEGDYDVNGDPIAKKEAKPMQTEDFRAMLGLAPAKNGGQAKVKKQDVASERPQGGLKVTPKSRFLPLSASQGKKKRPAPRPAVPATESQDQSASQTPHDATTSAKAVTLNPAARPKLALFSLTEDEQPATKETNNGTYEPILYETEEGEALGPDHALETTSTSQAFPPAHATTSATAAPASQNLMDIASELNLSKAERRALFGNKKDPNMASHKILEFNTATEYEHNEILRQQGEVVQHHALKSISGTGKNSLRSLVNKVSSNKEALEEHLATGKRNKREAGSKYGW